MNSMTRAVAWPVLSLLVIGGTHFAAEAIRPELHALIGPVVVLPVLLVAGAWVGFAVVRAGGTFIRGVVAGAILGLLPVVLEIVGFGVILGYDPAGVTTSAVFGFMAVVWGGSLGSGIASSMAAREPLRMTRPAGIESAPVAR